MGVARSQQDLRLEATGPSNEQTDRASVVWILEDSALEAQIAAQALGAEHAVEVFADGVALLERLANGGAPTLLLLDWRMPGLSGVDVCRVVRTTRDEVSLPIVVVTAIRESEDAVEALSAGANDFVTKPYSPGELLARVRTLARVAWLHDRARRAEQARSDSFDRLAQLTADLDRTTRELREEASFRERFIGIVGHDLRNPLSSIVLSASFLLRRDDLAEGATTTVERVLRSAHRMERMIADLLDFTRIRQGGGLGIVPGAMDLHEACRRIADDFGVTHPRRTVRLETRGDGHGHWDADRIAQVVINLVGNALEYGEPGTPVLLRASDDEPGDCVRIDVLNQGAAIEPGKAASLFEPFRRGDTARAGQGSKGLGLGLYIVRQIARAHGGDVSMSSSDDAGTMFTVRLPRRAVTAR